MVRRSFGTINIFAAGNGVIYCAANNFISMNLFLLKKTLLNHQLATTVHKNSQKKTVSESDKFEINKKMRENEKASLFSAAPSKKRIARGSKTMAL